MRNFLCSFYSVTPRLQNEFFPECALPARIGNFNNDMPLINQILLSPRIIIHRDHPVSPRSDLYLDGVAYVSALGGGRDHYSTRFSLLFCPPYRIIENQLGILRRSGKD